MPAPPILLVLAAGLGRRYGGLKQLDPVGPSGETVLEYSVFDALRSGFDRVVFVIRRDFEDSFRGYVDQRFGSQAEINYAFQSVEDTPPNTAAARGRTKPWGTAHAVWAAREHLDAPFAVANADDLYGLDAYQKLARFFAESDEAAEARGALVGFTLRNTLSPHGGVSRGVCQADDRGHLRSIEELTDIRDSPTGPRAFLADGQTRSLRGDEIVSMNLWGLRPLVLDDLGQQLAAFLCADPGPAALTRECFLPSCIGQLIDAGKLTVDVLSTTAPWFGVTYPEDRPAVAAAVERLIADGRYPSRLWS